MIRVCATATLLFATAFGSGTVRAQAKAKALVLTLDTRKTFQTIEHFGASDAWACQFVGQWPADKKEKMADWLFSSDTTADGTPKGIALSLWRFNLGAGSAEQGDSSGIKDEWRRAESLLTKERKFDFTKQAGQQWFLKAAHKRGVRSFLMFLNSPPVTMTNNHKAFADKGQCNLAAGRYQSLAAYIAGSIKGLQQQNNIRFRYVSPVNEPQWDWSDGGQEGNPYTNEQLSGVVRALHSTLAQSKLPVKISVTEAGHLKYLLEESDKPGRGNQLLELMRPGGPNYIGDLGSVDKAIAGHSYFSTSPSSEGIALRKRLADRIASVKGTSYWQSEYCILGDNSGEINGQKRDTGMAAALYLARVMYADLAVANAGSWQWWLAISPYDYKDGLIYIDKNKTDGAFTDSKLLWVLGNFSRFVRPGMVRIATGLSSDQDSCLASAFRDPATGKLVVVLINSSDASQSLDLKKQDGKGWKRIDLYTTSREKKLQHTTGSNSILLEPQSVTTLVISPQR
jgi:O-glycosyl hydrolase